MRLPGPDYWKACCSFDSLFCLAWAIIYTLLWIHPSWITTPDDAQLYAGLIQLEGGMSFLSLFLLASFSSTPRSGEKSSAPPLWIMRIFAALFTLVFIGVMIQSYRSWVFAGAALSILGRHILLCRQSAGTASSHAGILQWYQFGAIWGCMILALAPVFPELGLRDFSFPGVSSSGSDWTGPQFIIGGAMFYTLMAMTLGPLEAKLARASS